MTDRDNSSIPGREISGPIRRYNLAWHLVRVFLPLMTRLRARKGKEDAQRLDERFGLYHHRPDLPENPLWLHAVSVGESMAALALIRALAKAGDRGPYLITTNTVTAAERIRTASRSISDAEITHLYQPLDHPQFVDRFLAATRPRAAIFLESDFWPNLITRATQRQIPVFFVSSQMSDSAFAGWQRRAALAGEVFKTPHQVMTVDKLQADRFAALGTPQAAIKTGGSLKLPAAEPVIDPSLVQQITSAASGRKILLAASTHKGEEDVVLAAAAKLGAGWMCLLAPRHPHRGREIAARAKGAGVSCARRADGSDPQPAHSLYIVDTLGEMDSLFAVADTVFLGGSLVPRGGHNPIEPAAAGLPVISGPHIFKNQAEFDALAARGLLRIVTDADSLAAAAIAATSDAAAARRLSASARKFVAEAGKRPELAARSILKVIKAAKRDR